MARRLLAVLAVACGLVSCGYPSRAGLQAPFPLTHGGTPVPAQGIGGGFEVGEALRGPERDRADIMALFLAGGFANRISASYATYHGRTPDDLRGAMWRVKLRLGGAFGPRSALHVGYSRMDRSLFGGPHDGLRSWDVSIPMEFMLTGPRSPFDVALIFGPRAMVQRYTDHLDPSRSDHVLYIGSLGGAHVTLGILHIFTEATLTRVPELPGQVWSHRVVLLPSVGVLFQADPSQARGVLGTPFKRRAPRSS